MIDRGKNMTATEVVMADLKCSPVHELQDKGIHLQVDVECCQDR